MRAAWLGACVLLLVAGPASSAVLKIATIAPEGTAWMKQMRDGASEIKERTGGRVQFKFYGGGVMGNDKKVMRKIRIGQLNGGMFTPSSLSDVYPAIQLYGMPLVFRSLEEVDYVRSRMDQQLLEGLEQAGFVGFGLAEGGFAEILSNVPVTGIDDLKGRKVWIPEGDIITYNTMQAMGLSPVTLPITDVMTGLQTGLIDIVASSPVGAVVMQWHTKVKYVTNFPLVYLLGFMVVSKKDFDKLEAADQQVVREVFGRIYESFDKQNREDNGAAAQALLDSGLQAVELDEAEIHRWREVVYASNRDMAERGLISKDLLNQLLGYLEEFRANAAAAGGTR